MLRLARDSCTDVAAEPEVLEYPLLLTVFCDAKVFVPANCVLAIEPLVVAELCDTPILELDSEAVAVNSVDDRESGAAFEADVDIEGSVEVPAVLETDAAAHDVCVLDPFAIVLDVTMSVAFSAGVELPVKSACEEVV